MWREIRDGLRYVRRHRLISPLIATVTIANFAFGVYSAVIVVFLARQLDLKRRRHRCAVRRRRDRRCHRWRASSGAVAKRIGDARLLWLSAVINVPAILTLPLTSAGAGLTWFVVGQFVLNLGIALFNVCVRAAIQRSHSERDDGPDHCLDPGVQPRCPAARVARRRRARHRRSALGRHCS